LDTFDIKFDDDTDASYELNTFSEFIGLKQAAPNRYSILLLLQLYATTKSRHLNPAKVVHEIEALEGRGRSSNTKKPAPLTKAQLKGLWHKHYQEDGIACMAKNLQRAIHRYGIPWLEETIKEAAASGEEHFLTTEDISHITHDVVIGHWERLNSSQAITGEWIIYAKYQGLNYYLCIAKHDTGDALIRQHIDTICLKEFPFLNAILTPISK